MKDININEPLYVRYKEFTKNIEDASFFIGFKMIALAIIIISYLVISILENKELNKKNIKVWDKYVWTANYHNYFCDLYFPNEKQLKISRKSLLSWPREISKNDF